MSVNKRENLDENLIVSIIWDHEHIWMKFKECNLTFYVKQWIQSSSDSDEKFQIPNFSLVCNTLWKKKRFIAYIEVISIYDDVWLYKSFI